MDTDELFKRRSKVVMPIRVIVGHTNHRLLSGDEAAIQTREHLLR